jgi:hypothetical protein
MIRLRASVRGKIISVNFRLCIGSGGVILKQFSVREIIEAKSPEPVGGCNVERSRLRRARH